MFPDKKAMVLPAPTLISNAGSAQHINVLVELKSRKKSMIFFHQVLVSDFASLRVNFSTL